MERRSSKCFGLTGGTGTARSQSESHDDAYCHREAALYLPKLTGCDSNSHDARIVRQADVPHNGYVQ